MRALLIDDERLARNELRRLLANHREIEIVGEAATADEARERIEKLEPELLFLDVQMPGENGFDLLESLDSVPQVVFTTAYDEYALRAFEVSAADYLVKPIDPQRLAKTVERLLERVQHNRQTLTEHDRVFLNDGDDFWFVRLADVRLFESVTNHTRVFFASERPMIHRSLAELEPKLDARVFFRANRHQIINVKAVRSIHPWFGGRILVKLDGGHEVTLSRRRARMFREQMGL